MAVRGEFGNGLFGKRSLEFGHLLWGKDAVLGCCLALSLTPVAAPNASPNVFLAWGRMRRSGCESVF